MEKLLKQKSVMISSMNQEQFPEVSYAPFMIKENKIYLYLSKAANHYHNLTIKPQCSVMAIEDEETSKNVFARNRVVFSCSAHKMENVEESLLEEFTQIHGAQIMMVLKTLDFDLFELKIEKGRLVKGFGQAFDITIEDNEFKLNQVMGMGHK